MRLPIVTVIALLINTNPTQALASIESRTFQSQINYEIRQKPGPLEVRFSRLEQLGVEREAEQAAIGKCEIATREKCYGLGASSRCNYRIPPKNFFDTGSTACNAIASAAPGRDLR